ncbi:MAG: hypothetical protein EXX96DRAFT_519684 [Benjaminiella poitrasii]|nr:MAG: hypothetical protein EXX96DRAFT_519684 [Benjaminiella poitrasii]
MHSQDPHWANPNNFSPHYIQSQEPYSNGQSILNAIYVSNVPLLTPQQQQQQNSQLDEHGQPIKIRKKPGRKPNPASPALRKAQNRAAQRAFRERKERHLKELESMIRQLRDQRNSVTKEFNRTKSKLDAFRAENWYLKGVVLTLQFVCLYHNIHIPTHSPYLTEEALSEMAKTTPHAIEAYVNAYTKNNINLKPTMAAHFANVANDSSNDDNESEDMYLASSPKDQLYHSPQKEEFDEDSLMEDHDADTDNKEKNNIQTEPVNSPSGDSCNKNINTVSVSSPQSSYHKQKEEKMNSEQPSSISAIQHIRLQLRVQSTLSSLGKSAARLQPTILQLAIPHDPRIDLVPTPHMRDRMIIFRDQMDYDRCFAMLLNGAVYHGGDPTMSASWELPAEFFSEFWYLAINYDVSKTNTWRRMKGLPEINPKETLQHRENNNCEEGPHSNWNHADTSPSDILQQHNSDHLLIDSTNGNTMWASDIFAQMTEGMPSLQPLDSNHLSSEFDFGSPPSSNMLDNFLLHRPQQVIEDGSHPIFEHIMGSSPESRHERSPSLGAMMDLMNSLSTNASPS